MTDKYRGEYARYDSDRAPRMLDAEDVRPVDPLFCQMTTGAFPGDRKTADAAGVQLGMVIQPLNDNELLPEVPVVNFGPQLGVIRCELRQCRAYVNPYIRINQGLNNWTCNFCGKTNKIEKPYRNVLSDNPKAFQVENHRDELMNATIEIVAPQEYMVRAPQAPTYLFVICVNQRAIDSGMCFLACDTILSLIDDLPGGDRTRVGFLTYGAQLHFYEISGERKKPRMCVVSNVDSPYLPLPWTEFIVNVKNHNECIKNLLNDLPTYFEKVSNNHNCLGAAIRSAHFLVAETGGKVMIFNYGLPNVGLCKLTNRQGEQSQGIDDPRIKRQTDAFLAKSQKFAESQATVDMFAFSDGYCDLSTIAGISQRNGGDVRLYDNFKEEVHGDQFDAELRRNLTRSQGWEAVIRVRISKGFTIGDHYGHHFMRVRNLVCAPGIHADKSVAVEIKMGDDQKDRQFNHVFMQTALLYTTSSGSRRIRVHTVRLPLVNQPAQVISCINVYPYMTMTLRKAMQKIFSKDLFTARQFIQSSLVSPLSKYTAIAQRFLNSYQDYPEAIATWPDIILGALKAPAFRDQPLLPADNRVHQFCWLNDCPLDRIDLYVQPIMYAIDEMAIQGGEMFGMYAEDGTLAMPPDMPLTMASLETFRVLLIDNGVELIMWVGKDCDPNLLYDLFQCEEVLNEMHLIQPAQDEPEDTLSRRVDNVIMQCRSSCLYQRLTVVGQGSQQYDVNYFQTFLFEDRTKTVMNRDEFFQFLGQQTAPGRNS